MPLSRDVGLPPEHPTLPSLLKKAGYDTAPVRKWHRGKLPRYGPLLSGYDHFWVYRALAVAYYRHFGTDGKVDAWDGDWGVHSASTQGWSAVLTPNTGKGSGGIVCPPLNCARSKWTATFSGSSMSNADIPSSPTKASR